MSIRNAKRGANKKPTHGGLGLDGFGEDAAAIARSFEKDLCTNRFAGSHSGGGHDGETTTTNTLISIGDTAGCLYEAARVADTLPEGPARERLCTLLDCAKLHAATAYVDAAWAHEVATRGYRFEVETVDGRTFGVVFSEGRPGERPEALLSQALRSKKKQRAEG